MKTFKRKTFYTAVLAAMGAMGIAGSASAVQLSQDGTGSVLIYPYYTVRTAGNGPYNTYLNVVNTTASAKVVKVRFLEGKNSREVLDFNLWLSPNDVWTAAVVPTTNGATLVSTDQSCVTTAGGIAKSIAAGISFDFSNNAYAFGTDGATSNTGGLDGADTSLDRTREGYFEIIEMGVVTSSTLAAAVTHNSAGFPANCAAIPVVDSGAAGSAGGRIIPGTGGLIGGSTLINVNNGSDFGYDAVALEDFNPSAPLFSAPGSIQPDLTAALPFSNVVYFHDTGAGFLTTLVAGDFTSFPTGGVDAVSSVLERTSVMNTWILDSATNSSTDWVLTFPTKRYYIKPAVPTSPSPLTVANDNIRPFGTDYSEFGVNGSCGAFTLTAWNREEASPGIITTQVSPPAPGTPPSSLCWESTVLNFYPFGSAAPTPADTLFGSTNGRTAAMPNGFQNGWAKIEFGTGSGATFNGAYTNLVDDNLVTFHGLPVVGFMAKDYLNPFVTIGGLPSASSYGDNFVHKYTRRVSGTGITNAANVQYDGANITN